MSASEWLRELLERVAARLASKRGSSSKSSMPMASAPNSSARTLPSHARKSRHARRQGKGGQSPSGRAGLANRQNPGLSSLPRRASQATVPQTCFHEPAARSRRFWRRREASAIGPSLVTRSRRVRVCFLATDQSLEPAGRRTPDDRGRLAHLCLPYSSWAGVRSSCLSPP